jgi:hypothetical protein
MIKLPGDPDSVFMFSLDKMNPCHSHLATLDLWCGHALIHNSCIFAFLKVHDVMNSKWFIIWNSIKFLLFVFFTWCVTPLRDFYTLTAPLNS